MIRSITVTNYLGDSLTLELARPEKSGFLVKSVDGLGPAKGDINTVDVSTNDGGVFNSARLAMRNIVFDLTFIETESETVESLRHKSYRYFPVKKKVLLSIETDERVSEIEGYVEYDEPIIFSRQEGCQISIICPYPYFYSSGEPQVIVFSGIDPEFEFPFENVSVDQDLLEFSKIQTSATKTVVYDGDAEVGFTITIYALGEASNITIYNSETREAMRLDTSKLASLTGSGIVAGDEITITTVKGNKSITLLREGVITNILNCLDRDVDWLQLSKGDNVIGYAAETGSNNLQLRVEYRIIYEGV